MTIDAQGMGYKLSAAVLPGQEELDRLLCCHADFSRGNDRIPNRLEWLQRIRKGQLLPHELDV
jgi:hypothetical protein